MTETKTFIYGDNAWGAYYNSLGELVYDVEALTQESTLSLYLYGALSRPDNPADYIRDVNSPSVAVNISSADFLSQYGSIVGAVLAATESKIEKFYNGELDYIFNDNRTSGEPSVVLRPMDIADVLFPDFTEVEKIEEWVTTFSFVDFGSFPGWIDGTFIYNSVNFRLANQTEFQVVFDADGNIQRRELSNIRIELKGDNYDYDTTGPIASDISKYAHGEYHDPYNIGKKFHIQFDGAEGENTYGAPTPLLPVSSSQTWTEADWRAKLVEHAEFSNDNLGWWALQGEAIAAQSSGDGQALSIRSTATGWFWEQASTMRFPRWWLPSSKAQMPVIRMVT